MPSITGNVYVREGPSLYKAVPAEYWKVDPQDAGRILVVMYPEPPSVGPGTTAQVQVASVLQAASPPTSGDMIYVST